MELQLLLLGGLRIGVVAEELLELIYLDLVRVVHLTLVVMRVGQRQNGRGLGDSEFLEELSFTLLHLSKDELILVGFGQALEERSSRFTISEIQNLVLGGLLIDESFIVLLVNNANEALHLARR